MEVGAIPYFENSHWYTGLFKTGGKIVFENYFISNLTILQNYMIPNLTDASFCGMVINIKPSDSKNLLEDGGKPNVEKDDVPKENIVTSQILLESLLRRIGNCCLILSVILFLGQIINAAIEWDLAISSVITGFGFSIFLFMSWACIDSVYGKGASEVR